MDLLAAFGVLVMFATIGLIIFVVAAAAIYHRKDN